MAPLSRVVEASARPRAISFLAAGSLRRPRYSLEPRAASIFRQRLARSSRYYYSVWRVCPLAVRRASRANAPQSNIHDGSAAKLPRALVAPPKVVFAPPTTSSEACLLASVLQAASYAGLTLSLQRFALRIAASLPVQAVHLANILHLHTAARCRCISRPLPASAASVAQQPA